MLELSKTILEKVSFDKSLFRKELIKAAKWLKPDEKLVLKVWCLSTFGSAYREVIMEAFKTAVKA